MTIKQLIQVFSALGWLALSPISARRVNGQTGSPGQKNLGNGHAASKEESLQLIGNRFLTFASVVGVNQIEATRTEFHGVDESAVHSPQEARLFREAIEKAWPGQG